jgi:hypothetical protein
MEMEGFLALFNTEEYEECTIALADSFSLDRVTLSDNSSGTVLIIKSEGAGEKTLSLASLSIGSGVSLVLEENVTLEGLDTGNYLVWVAGNGGAFTMEEGSKVHGNTGGGVYVGSDGTFTMNGGEISGNSISNAGGGVVVYGTFTMSGGEISDNSAFYGGGVCVYNSGTFTMSGGEVSDNTASGGGGGVYVSGSGTFFTMNGGEVSGNTLSAAYSAAYGGGVYVNGGTFTMNGGEISSNSVSSSYGGGVYVGSGGTFTKQSGGVIYGSNAGSLSNSASNRGQAVYVDSGSKQRNSTAGEGVTLDSSKSGSAGGWE